MVRTVHFFIDIHIVYIFDWLSEKKLVLQFEYL